MLFSDTYLEAVKRVELLAIEEYVYTTDVDQSPEEKAEEETRVKRVKPEKLRVDLDEQDCLLNSAPKLVLSSSKFSMENNRVKKKDTASSPNRNSDKIEKEFTILFYPLKKRRCLV